jgi:hypothetical protein
VVHHHVGDDPDAPAVGLVEEPGDVVDVTRLGQHRVELADVVAAVAQRRLVEGQEPQAVDAQPFEVVELLRQAGEVAEPVAVRVEEPAYGHLVEDGSLVPPVVGRIDRRGHTGPRVTHTGQPPNLRHATYRT